MNVVDTTQVVILGTLEVKVPKPVQYIHNVYTQYTNTQPEILLCIFKIKIENEQKKIPKNCVASLVRNVCPTGAWNFYGLLMTIFWFNPSQCLFSSVHNQFNSS